MGRRECRSKLTYYIQDNNLHITYMSKNTVIKINQIKDIEINLVEPFKYIITLNTSDEKYIPINCSLIAREDAKKLFDELKMINQNINIDKKVKSILYDNRGPRFNFSTEGSIFERDRMSRLRNPTLDTFLGLFAVALLLVLIVLPVKLTPMYFQTNITAKTASFCVSSFSFGFALMNLISALVSAYLGHLVTKISVGVGILFFIIGIAY